MSAGFGDPNGFSCIELDLIPLFITFVCCVFISLEIGILIGTAVNLAMLLYATARPRIKLFKMEGRLCGSYLLVTPDRSLVFTAMDYFMSTVRKASALHPGVPVVIDMSYVTIADFTTAYVRDSLQRDLEGGTLDCKDRDPCFGRALTT